MPSKLIKGALSALRKEPEEKKMLQGFYRGFAGEGGDNPEVFVTPQKRVADYYAQKRAGQTGQEPHAEMVLADPFAGRAYGHSTPGTGKQEPLFTRARKMKESDVVDRTSLYTKGGAVKSVVNSVYEMAHKLAQRNAALPVEKGGLGLHSENTAAERAKAMGYTQEVYHSALEDVGKFNPTGKFAGHKGVSGISTTDNPQMANRYLERYGDRDYKGQEFSKNVMPLLLKPGRVVNSSNSPFKSPVPMGHPLPEGYVNPMVLNSLDTLIVPDSISRKGPVKHSDAKNAIKGREFISSDPSNLRSRFAAFDPFESSSPDLLKAKGGPVSAFKDGGAAFGVFPQMRPRRAENSGAGDRMTEEALKFMIPQDTLDLALMALPFGKAGKAAAAGLMALTPSDAEAGKLKTGVDLARRSLFGLKPSQDMAGRELAPMQRDMDRMRAELNRAEKAAPKVEERSVSIDPGKGSAKITDTVQKVASTPVSRRTVLKSATGQVLQNALPMQSFADLMKPAEVVKQAAQVVAPVAVAADALVPGLMAKAVKMGLGEKEAMEFVAQNLPKGAKGAESIDLGAMHHVLEDPIRYSVQEGLPTSRIDVMREMLQQPPDAKPLQMRGALRGVKSENPDMYRDLREMATDIVEYGHEN